jgi:diguanylate cyclase (GGDEF)-like protein
MGTESPAPNATHGFASRALLGLQLLALALGALQFAFAPETVHRPMLAALALAALTVVILLVRSVPMLQRSLTRQYWIEIVSLTGCTTLLAVATGAAHSPLIPLYLIPLTGVALAFGRWWLVLVAAAVVAGLGFLLGALTPETDIGSREFGVLLLSALAPSVAVTLLVAAMIERMQDAAQRINDLAATDALTGLMNLRTFEDVLTQEHRKAERFGRPYALAVIDVDNVSFVNESMGHDAGSQVISAVGAALARSIRNSDVAARLGGDEFVVLLTEADASMATAIAQRIRNNVYASTISVANRVLRPNISLGIANFPEDHLYSKELMILADQRMQQDRDHRRQQSA